MEYAKEIEPIYNDQFIKHVGFTENMCGYWCGESCVEILWSEKNLKSIQKKITLLLQNSCPQAENRPIIVPLNTIASVMSNVYDNFRPKTGDIYGRYNIPECEIDNYVRDIINRTINIITNDVEINIGMDRCNSNLSIWTTILGDFNKHGLRQHSKIKLRERRPTPMQFNMNY